MLWQGRQTSVHIQIEGKLYGCIKCILQGVQENLCFFHNSLQPLHRLHRCKGPPKLSTQCECTATCNCTTNAECWRGRGGILSIKFSGFNRRNRKETFEEMLFRINVCWLPYRLPYTGYSFKIVCFFRINCNPTPACRRKTHPRKKFKCTVTLVG